METRRYRLPRDRGRRRAIRLRIRALVDKDAGAERVRWNNAGGSRCHRFPALFVIQEEVQAVFPDNEERREAEAAGADRKSTRLNSSHLVISYAVFCLKKKKEQRPNRPAII